MSAPQSEPTLAEYLRVLRRRRLLIVIVALACGAAALALSLVQQASYNATASLAVNDPNQDLSLLGSALVSNQTPLQLASIHAPQVTRVAVLQRVKSDLRSPLSLAALKKSVTVGVDPNSFLVTIDAQAPKAARAAAIANAFARADVALTTAAARRSYAVAATQLGHKLRTLPAATQPATKQIYTTKLSELQSLSSIATPVQLSAAATPPSSSSSPKPLRNTVAALIFGLLLGIALAYGRELLDRRLRSSSDVEQQFDRPVLGHVRADALGNAGLGGGSNGNGPLADVDAEAFRILRHNVRYLAASDSASPLLVTSAMAQEGKSTVAACLAMAIAETGRQTLLVECDLRRPVLADRLKIAAEPGLTDYLTGQAEPEDIMQVISRPAGHSGPSTNGSSGSSERTSLVCITAGSTAPRPAALLGSDRFREFLAEVSEVYDSVIIDSAPLLSVADTLEIVHHVSGVLLCTRLRRTTRDQARATRAALDRLPSHPTGVVLTGVSESEDSYLGYYRSNAAAAAPAHRA
jgi:polysaccharide biosynthesis transport protein